MSNKSDYEFDWVDFLFYFALCFFCFVGGCTSGVAANQSSMQAECVERGFAEYNSQTGEWQWKEAEKIQCRNGGEAD